MKNMFKRLTIPVALLTLIPATAWASESASDGGHGTTAMVATLAFVGIMVAGSKMAGALAERFKQVSVLGEIGVGLLLALPAVLGWTVFEGFRKDTLLLFLAEFGVILLLFQTGLESNLREMTKVGARALAVAVVGVACPFLLGRYVVGPWLLPEASSHAWLFLGATLTATSVGITARVFKDLNIGNTVSAKIVLGAAVIDDILGLIILAVVASLVKSGALSGGEVAWLFVKAIGFLGLSIMLGRVLAEPIGRALSRIHRGEGMKIALVLAFCLGYAYLANLVGLAPIVGAFAAGLLLDPVHFHRFASPKFVAEIEGVMADCTDERANASLRTHVERYRERHVEDLINVLALWFVPIFFVYTGFQVDLVLFADPSVLGLAAGITVVAILGKLVSGFAAGKGANWKLVGIGMVPRGEVGLIFLNLGLSLGVVDDRMFAAALIMIMVTTVLTPVLLPYVVKRTETVAPPVPVTG